MNRTIQTVFVKMYVHCWIISFTTPYTYITYYTNKHKLLGTKKMAHPVVLFVAIFV